ncbi:ABC transporter permease [Rhabdothermincola salaria]|uniref:ABC transporter permease n=1 Tax=Rhabdothermincola salaria TaxID=2903142 RepID=UPI001E54F921|nr:ABC transporter permease subunit [Rhabdothermincola salaria]
MSDARILDRGYRAYTGPRTGVRGAVRSLVVHSTQRALGLKRPVWQKVLPLLAVFIAYVPAIVFVGISVLLPDVLLDNAGVLPTYVDYYGFISAAIVVFAAFVAPELLCTDRRTGMLGLYLASPLTRNTYLLGKAVAVVVLLALVTLGPLLLMLAGFVIVGRGPDGPAAVAELLLQMVLGGLAVAVVQAALSLAVASTTSRKAAASAAIILILLASTAVSDALLTSAAAPDIAFGLNLVQLPFELVARIYDEPSGITSARDIATGTIVALYAGWTALFAGFTWLRYRRMTVTR